MWRTSRLSGWLYCALFLVVVLLDVVVGHLHVLGDLLEDLLRDDLRADVVPHLRLRQALLLQLLLVLLLVAAEVLLEDLVEAGVDLLVGHLDVHVLRFLLELLALDEELDGLVAEGLELLGAGRGELALLVLVGLLRLADQRLVVAPGDIGPVDDRDGVGRNVLVTATAGERQRRRARRGEGRGERSSCESAPGVRVGAGSSRLTGSHDSIDKFDRPLEFICSTRNFTFR